MATVEETYKLAANTRFAVLGRALVDARHDHRSRASIVEQLASLRLAEHERQGFVVRIAALARQVGDAARSGADLGPLLAELMAVVDAERHGHIPEEQRVAMREAVLSKGRRSR